MWEKPRILLAAIVSSICAGPISLIVFNLLFLRTRSVSIDLGSAAAFLLLLPYTAQIFILAFGPNLLGTIIFAGAARRHRIARSYVFWIAIGAVLGAVSVVTAVTAFPIHLIEPDLIRSPELWAATLTSAACAGICRRVVALD